MTVPILTRLHISPLNPDLLPLVLGSQLSDLVHNVSFQNIDTFPENNYGFLDLPSADAKRLMSKLNGAILKGRKMRVEEARPKKRVRGGAEEDVEQSEKPQKNSKKLNKEDNVLEGHEMPKERRVKRGWTEPKSERLKRQKSVEENPTKSQAPSKYTEKEELLFRTILPPNKEGLIASKKGKATRNQSSDHTIHEFEKTSTQPSFLRSTTSTSKPVTRFVDGDGWVDEEGQLVEEEPSHVKRRKAKKAEDLKIDIVKAQQPRRSTRKVELKPESAASTTEEKEDENSISGVDDATSSSGTSSDEDVQMNSAVRDTDMTGLGILEDNVSQELPQIESEKPPETPTKVHPLEALFKKPKLPEGQESAKPSLEVETKFSFFDPDPDEDEDDDELPDMPVTPFASQELNSRGIRSAAPTPDTAHPSRFTGYAAAFESRLDPTAKETDTSDGQELQAHKPSKSVEPGQESEFEKRFWADRAQNNHAWKARRRTAMKEERQKENRLRRTRNR